MASRGHENRNVKLGTGGIREIEFLVQAVQVLCGGRKPGILDRSTMGALSRFRKCGLLTATAEAKLAKAYLFLRDVEHKLQMVHDLQTHALPDSEQELARCAVRLGYGKGKKELDRFAADLKRHRELVHQTFQSLFASPSRSGLLKAALRRNVRSS
jgi:glutamate-ammonia-ligase adenylyltransferase